MQLTRETLHRLVWSKPMPRAARELGLSRSALERACATLAVPYPFSGFWRDDAPLDLGLRPLPRAPTGTPEAIEIPDPPRRAGSPAPAAPVEAPSPKIGDTASARREAGSAIPAKAATDLHPILAAQAEERRRWDAMGSQGTKAKPVDPLTHRWRRLENQLFQAVEAAGHAVELEARSLWDVRLKVQGQLLTYRLRERYTRTRRTLSAAEARDPLNVRLGRTYAFDNVMTGEAVLAVQTHAYGRKTEWRDRPGAPLETQMDAVVEGLEALARDAIRIDAERREAEARWRAQEARRAEAERRAQAEEDRWDRLCELADAHAQARRVSDLLRRLQAERSARGDADPAFRRWLAWAWRELAARDPLAWGLADVVAEVDGADGPNSDDDL